MVVPRGVWMNPPQQKKIRFYTRLLHDFSNRTIAQFATNCQTCNLVSIAYYYKSWFIKIIIRSGDIGGGTPLLQHGSYCASGIEPTKSRSLVRILSNRAVCLRTSTHAHCYNAIALLLHIMSPPIIIRSGDIGGGHPTFATRIILCKWD